MTLGVQYSNSNSRHNLTFILESSSYIFFLVPARIIMFLSFGSLLTPEQTPDGTPTLHHPIKAQPYIYQSPPVCSVSLCGSRSAFICFVQAKFISCLFNHFLLELFPVARGFLCVRKQNPQW